MPPRGLLKYRPISPTQGVAGIGIVNAVEVVQAFGKRRGSCRSEAQGAEGGPADSRGSNGGSASVGFKDGTRSCAVIGQGLHGFKEWLEAPDEGLLAAAARAGGIAGRPEISASEERAEVLNNDTDSGERP